MKLCIDKCHIYLFIAFGVHLLYVIVWDYTTEQKMNSFFNLLIVQNQIILPQKKFNWDISLQALKTESPEPGMRNLKFVLCFYSINKKQSEIGSKRESEGLA